MSNIQIGNLIPAFIMADRNGYALAKGMEKLLQIMDDKVHEALEAFSNPDAMPEWRLDELAWETNCLYDYTAPVEVKRRWIRDALPLTAALGTPQAIYNYLNGYFDSVELEENWQYGGEPFHFRVTVSGEWNETNEAWMLRAIESAKNVRSVLDSAAAGSSIAIGVKAECEAIRFVYAMSGDAECGTLPDEAVQTIHGDIRVHASESAESAKFDYPMLRRGAVAGYELLPDAAVNIIKDEECTAEITGVDFQPDDAGTVSVAGARFFRADDDTVIIT